MYVAVNVAPRTLASSQLRELLGDRPLERVVFELTEHARVASYEPLREVASYYRGRGARIAVDDAGSGYASFQHILELRPDIIKLDRSLTTGIDRNPVLIALATSLVTFAESLGARVCAEGIETSAELVALQQLGVRYGQGYFLGRPNPLPVATPPAGQWMIEDVFGSFRVPPEVRSAKRLASLRSTRLMDSEAEEDFDRLTRLAAQTLGVPISAISLIDERRQFFKSRVGVGVSETPLSHSFCVHVVTQGSPLVVADARKHPLVRENPAVIEGGVLAYAGIPIITADLQTLGSFCAVDVRTHEWTAGEIAFLSELAAVASTLIDVRKHALSLAATADLAPRLVETSPDAVAIVDLEMNTKMASPRFCELARCSRESLIGRGIGEWNDGDARERFVAARDRLLAGHASELRDSIRLLQEGVPVTRVTSVELLRDADGTPESFLVRIRDDVDDAA